MSAQEPFRLEEATIDELHEAIKAGKTTCVAVVQHYIDRVRAYNGVASLLVTEDGAPVAAATGAVRARAPLRFPTETVKASDDLPRSRQVSGPAARIRPHGADRLRPFGAAAIRDDRRQAQCRPAQCARHPQHPRRAFGDLPRRVRPAPLRGAAAARRAAGLRAFSQTPRCARTRRRARRDLRAQSRSRQDADVRRRLLVQGPVRHQGHAHDRRRRRGLRHRFPGARPCAGRAIAQQGRDHFRQGGLHRIQRPRRRSRRPAHSPKRCCRRCSAISAAAGAATRPTPTTRRAPPRWGRARARASRSAPISSWRASARRPAPRPAAPPTTMRWP